VPTQDSSRGRLRRGELVIRLARPVDWRSSFADLSRLLDAAEKARAARFRVEHASIAYTFAHGLLRRWLAELSGLAPEGLAFTAHSGGKPRLRDHPRLCFSLSHTRGLVAAVVALDREVGIDVEAVDDGEMTADLLALALSAAERQDLEGLPPTDRREAFFRAWTRKEALLKAAGEGLSRAPAEVEVAPFDSAEAQPLSWTAGGEGEDLWRVADLSVPAGFCGAVAWRDRPEGLPRLDVVLDLPAGRTVQ
jgi:4'-phosphopantetheinyl transferase